MEACKCFYLEQRLRAWEVIETYATKGMFLEIELDV